MKKFLLLLILISATLCPPARAQNMLSNSAHAAPAVDNSIIAACNGNPSCAPNSTFFTDATSNNATFLSSMDLVSAAVDTLRTNYSVSVFGIGGPTNHAPYKVLTQSSTGYTYGDEVSNYVKLESNDQVYNFAIASPSSSQIPPPIAMATTALNGAGSNWGIEFTNPSPPWTLSCGSGTLLTDSLSDTTASMTGLLLMMRFNHSTWKWGDVKAALRQTASNWATGYSHTAYGYGTVDYCSAVAIASTASLYLQPPNMQIMLNRYYAVITLFPFKQTRRSNEVVYSCTPGYVWPVKNEYTLADVSAGCGTLIYTSNGTDVTPSFPYEPAMSGTLTIIAFTTDGSGNYSRVEEFSQQQATFLVGNACLN